MINGTLNADLQEKLDQLQDLIDEVIGLKYLTVSLNKARKKLAAAENARIAFYTESKVPDIIFLNSTMRGKELFESIKTARRNVNRLEFNIKILESERRTRLQPFRLLTSLVSSTNSPQHAATLIDHYHTQAKELNPEGSLADKIKMIFSIIKEIITLHFSEIPGIIAEQKKRNEVRVSVNGIFKTNFSPDAPLINTPSSSL